MHYSLWSQRIAFIRVLDGSQMVARTERDVYTHLQMVVHSFVFPILLQQLTSHCLALQQLVSFAVGAAASKSGSRVSAHPVLISTACITLLLDRIWSGVKQKQKEGCFTDSNFSKSLKWLSLRALPTTSWKLKSFVALRIDSDINSPYLHHGSETKIQKKRAFVISLWSESVWWTVGKLLMDASDLHLNIWKLQTLTPFAYFLCCFRRA